MHYPGTPSTRQKKIARSAFTDVFLPMLLNHEVHFMVLKGINRTAWGTKLLYMAVWASLVDCISLYHILKAHHCFLSPNGYFNLPLAPQPPPPPTRHPL